MDYCNFFENRKFFEQQQKEYEEKTKEAWENYKKVEEVNKKNVQIDNEMKEVLNKIKKFELESSIGALFDENIALMQPVSSLPENVYQDFKDAKAYELSRFGITKKFQIMIFPYFDDETFVSEFLGYFLRNSCFSQENPSKINESHFAFHLIGVHISAFTPAIADEESDTFCFSNYLLTANEVKRQTEANNFKRCFYMIFDTYIGEGSQILSDVVLDVKIKNNVLSEACVEKLKKMKIFDFDEKVTLKAFALKHIKSMKIATKLFHEINTFHPISLRPNYDNKFNRSNDVCLVFMKVFRDAVLPKPKTEDEIKNEELDNKQKEKPISILGQLLKRTSNKGMNFIGMKTIYFHEENYHEFSHTFEKSKYFEPNIPILAFAFAGFEAPASKS